MSHSIFYKPFYDFDCILEAFSPTTNGGRARRAFENDDDAVRSLKPRRKTSILTFTVDALQSLQRPNISDDDDKSGYAIRERRFGKVSRTLQLPQGVKDDEIKAYMENGILTATFPKTAPELTSKKITIA